MTRYDPTAFEDNVSGTVLTWQVSEPLSSSSMRGAQLTGAALNSFEWQEVWAEEKGITNLAHAINGREGKTILARVDLESAEEKVIPVRFGYSDKVSVYLNGQLLYRGDNTYISRDYRYLGTIGQFDELPLALQSGTNNLVFVVDEGFGGWGITAVFPSTEGIGFGDGVIK